MKKGILFLFSLLSISLFGSDLEISNVEFRQLRSTTGEQKVKMTVRWDNAWNNQKNHDAAWIMIKFVDLHGGYSHALLAAEACSVLLDIQVPPSSNQLHQ